MQNWYCGQQSSFTSKFCKLVCKRLFKQFRNQKADALGRYLSKLNVETHLFWVNITEQWTKKWTYPHHRTETQSHCNWIFQHYHVILLPLQHPGPKPVGLKYVLWSKLHCLIGNNKWSSKNKMKNFETQWPVVTLCCNGDLSTTVIRNLPLGKPVKAEQMVLQAKYFFMFHAHYIFPSKHKYLLLHNLLLFMCYRDQIQRGSANTEAACSSVDCSLIEYNWDGYTPTSQELVSTVN